MFDKPRQPAPPAAPKQAVENLRIAHAAEYRRRRPGSRKHSPIRSSGQASPQPEIEAPASASIDRTRCYHSTAEQSQPKPLNLKDQQTSWILILSPNNSVRTFQCIFLQACDSSYSAVISSTLCGEFHISRSIIDSPGTKLAPLCEYEVS
jgi:hypothetical protein